jgi:hypothetical protein
MIFPASASTDVSTTTTTTSVNDRGINFLFDFTNREFVMTDGKLTGVSGDAAVVFWIEKTIRTEYERAIVYRNTGYGFGLERFVGVALPPSIVKLVFEDKLKQSLYQNERIKSIDNFSLTKVSDDSQVTISFDVTLNPVTVKESDFTIVADETFNRISTLEQIKEFVSIEIADTSSFAYTSTLSNSVYVTI